MMDIDKVVVINYQDGNPSSYNEVLSAAKVLQDQVPEATIVIVPATCNIRTIGDAGLMILQKKVQGNFFDDEKWKGISATAAFREVLHWIDEIGGFSRIVNIKED